MHWHLYSYYDTIPYVVKCVILLAYHSLSLYIKYNAIIYMMKYVFVLEDH